MAALTFDGGANSVNLAKTDYVLTEAVATPGDFKAIQLKLASYNSDAEGAIYAKQLNSLDNSQFDTLEMAENVKTSRLENGETSIVFTLKLDTRGVSHMKLAIENASTSQVTLTGII